MKNKRKNPDITMTLLAAKAGMNVKTARKYIRKGKLPSELKIPRKHRTRIDPFEKHQEIINQMLSKYPGLQAKTLLYYLMEQYPNIYNESHLRSLQRRVKEIGCFTGRGKEVIFLQEIEPGKQSQSDWVVLNDLNVTIENKEFPHKLFHFMLPYSKWEDIMICYSESFETLSKGFVNAVNKLGGTLREHRTDNLSAATKKSVNSRTFTDRWQSFLEHYNVTPSRNNAGQSHENGSVEKSNDLIKSAINQHLLLRGHRNFSSISEYELFINNIVKRRNDSRKQKLEEELKYLQALPTRDWNDPIIINVRVSPSSTVRILGIVYSVPSRLISYHLKVYVYSEKIDLFYGTKVVLSLERSKECHVIDYRHIIDSLVRKPGAFAKYKYHNHLFPLLIFRTSFDELIKESPNTGHKEYLRILQLAKCYGEQEVVSALELCKEIKIVPNAKTIEEFVREPNVKKYEAKVLMPNLKEYDSLYTSKLYSGKEQEGVAC